jgi:hypothetical protein
MHRENASKPLISQVKSYHSPIHEGTYNISVVSRIPWVWSRHIPPLFSRFCASTNCYKLSDYGERYRNGEPITTSFVESTVNQVVSKRFCKRQQMQWSKRGAHLLLQARVKILNREWAAVFKGWYPDLEVEEWDKAA